MRWKFSIVAALTMIASLVPALPAAAACPSSGGVTIGDAPTPSGDVVFHGRGKGHGLGMSQLGANGAAALGCNHEQILETYYQGAELKSHSGGNEIVVGIVDPKTHQPKHAARIDVVPPSSSVAWRCTMKSGGNCASHPPTQKAGERWQMIPDQAGRFRLFAFSGGERESKPFWTGGERGARLTVLHDGDVIEVTPRLDGSAINSRTVRWGQLEMITGSTSAKWDETIATSWVRQRVTAGPDGADPDGRTYRGLDRYLWGLHEVSSSFELAAQQAQAVAARTYALRRVITGLRSDCRCHVVTTPKDQNYKGWAFENADRKLGFVWRDQVKRTRQQVMMRSGSLITAMYSASHGGHSQSNTYVFGTSPVSYLQPVDDSRWDKATDKTKWPNGDRAWARGFTWKDLASRFEAHSGRPFDRVTDISVAAPLGSAARDDGVRISARRDGRSVTETWTGWNVRQALGLPSPNFLIRTHLSSARTPITGDWNGDGRDELGWYDNGNVALRMRDGTVRRYPYGRDGDVPIVGDFNGDGRDTVSIIRDGEWHINNRLSGGDSELMFTYGRITRGDVPIIGDWDGNGRDDIGIIRDGEWHLRFSLSGGHAQHEFVYGRITRGDVPIIGDWDRNGRDDIGIVRDGEWHLRFSLSGGYSQHMFVYGRVLRGDVPVIGDWDRNGRDDPGIERDGVWHLRNSLSGGAADTTIKFPS